jgi:hypothetical protein
VNRKQELMWGDGLSIAQRDKAPTYGSLRVISAVFIRPSSLGLALERNNLMN